MNGDDLFNCPVCGSHQFGFDREANQGVCSMCGYDEANAPPKANVAPASRSDVFAMFRSQLASRDKENFDLRTQLERALTEVDSLEACIKIGDLNEETLTEQVKALEAARDRTDPGGCSERLDRIERVRLLEERINELEIDAVDSNDRLALIRAVIDGERLGRAKQILSVNCPECIGSDWTFCQCVFELRD